MGKSKEIISCVLGLEEEKELPERHQGSVAAWLKKVLGCNKIG